MSIDTRLIEISQWKGEGFQPLVDSGDWRVAILRFINHLLPENITRMQRHDETDEVFVLLKGRCVLFIGEGDGEITNIHAQDMDPLKLYNVKQSCWHTHTLSEDAVVLVIENRNTSDHNSPEIDLTADQRQSLVAMTKSLYE